MAQVIVRNLDAAIVVRLKRRAAANNRSLEQELRLVLAAAARPGLGEFRKIAAAIRQRSAGRRQTDSVRLIREDRDR